MEGCDTLHSRNLAPWAALFALLVIAVAIYAPGLSGGFTYDDMSFVVGNAGIQIHTTDLRDWVAAAFSFPGGLHQGRWLGMLSFAANHGFTGLDPFWFKLTNLAIHLLNGVLVFLALRALFALRRECVGEPVGAASFDGPLAAAAIAGLWLVLPINLTAVLYVSQRLESLSNTFVFLGLWWYLRVRLAHWRGERGAAGLWISLLVCSGIGVLVKESAAMLPLYAACAEFAIARAHNRDGSRSRGITALYLCVLLLPLLLGLAWLASWMFGPTTYSRPFDTWQRLLTESRVLVDYLRWTLAPSLDALTLYHDDIEVSHGLLDPPTTLVSIIGLAGLLAVALWQRTRRPLFTVGILWFFCGHLLTATIIPLLLAFEHRNYFPSLGLLLAGASLFALEGGLQRSRMRVALAALVIGFYAFTTWMRAQEWSDPMRLALSEASKRPGSALAQYDRAMSLIHAGTMDGRPVLKEGLLALDSSRHLPGASIMYEQMLITTLTDMGQPVDPDWWTSLIQKLRTRPPTISDAKSLANLNGCFLDKKCKEDLPLLAQAYAAALSFPRPPAALLFVHAEFAWWLQDDHALAETDTRTAVARSPLDPNARRSLAILLMSIGKLGEARVEVDALKGMNYFGMLDKLIAPIEHALRDKEHAVKASADSPLTRPDGSR
jgi:hypothetical protein